MSKFNFQPEQININDFENVISFEDEYSDDIIEYPLDDIDDTNDEYSGDEATDIIQYDEYSGDEATDIIQYEEYSEDEATDIIQYGGENENIEEENIEESIVEENDKIIKLKETLNKNGLLFNDEISYTEKELLFYANRLSYIFGKRKHLKKLDVVNVCNYDDYESQKEALEADLSLYKSNLQKAINNLKINQKSLNYKMDIDKLSPEVITQTSNIKLPNGTNQRFRTAVVSNILCNIVDCVDADISSEAVLSSVITDVPNSICNSYNADEVYNYIDTIISKIRLIVKDRSTSSASNININNNIDNIFKDNLNTIEELQIKNLSNKLNVILQIIKKGDKFFCKCCNCGNEIILETSVVQAIIFDNITIRKYATDLALKQLLQKVVVLPLPINCKCGHTHILSNLDISDATINFLEKNKANITLTTELTNSLSTTKINLSAAILLRNNQNSIIKEIVSDYSDPIEINTSISYDDNEYWKAVESLYNKIYTIKNQKVIFNNKEQLTYKQLANYLANNLSLNYKYVKNKCIFSIILWIKENKFLDKFLDIKNLIQLQKEAFDLNILQKIKDFEEVDKNKKLLLLKYVDKEYEKLNTNELQTVINESYNNKLSELEKHKKCREKVINTLIENKDLMSYIKIINTSASTTELYASIMADPRIANLIDEISDRMIITNYSENFSYNLARMHSIKNALKSIENSIDKEEATKNLHRIIKSLKLQDLKTDDSIYGTLSDIINIITNRFFCLYKDTSTITLEDVAKAATFIKNADIFNAVLYINKSKNLSFDILGTKNEKLVNAVYDISNNLNVFTNYKDAFEFYLEKAGFTLDDIRKNKALLDGIKFSYRIPKRIPNETMSDYYIRFKDSTELENNNSNLYTDYFNNFSDQIENFTLILLASLVHDIGYKHYLSSVLTIGLSEYLIKATNKDNALEILKCNNSIFSILEKNMYRPKLKVNNYDTFYKLFMYDYETPLVHLIEEIYSDFCDKQLEVINSIDFHDYTSNLDDLFNSISSKIDTFKPSVNMYTSKNKSSIYTTIDEEEANDITVSMQNELNEVRSVIELWS